MKATFDTNRPLTEEERIFAMKDENYNLLFAFMRQKKLNQEDWYDVLVIAYLQAVKKYFERTDLQHCTFNTILYNVLLTEYVNTARKFWNPIRMPEGGILSLEYEWDNSESDIQKMREPWWEDKTNNTEKKVINKITMLNIIERLSDLQNDIFSMLMDNCTKKSICEDLNISYKALQNEIKLIQEIALSQIH